MIFQPEASFLTINLSFWLSSTSVTPVNCSDDSEIKIFGKIELCCKVDFSFHISVIYSIERFCYQGHISNNLEYNFECNQMGCDTSSKIYITHLP